MNKSILLLCTLILSLGIFGGGYSIGRGVALFKNRTVTVKGLAEQDIKSDLGIWEINYREMGNDLIQLDQRLMHDQEVVVAFLKQQGFTDQEIERVQLKIEDRLANVYQNQEQNTNVQRYVVTAGTRVRSEKVDLMWRTAQILDKLIPQGVPLTFDASISPNPSFYFTKLDTLRPSMLAEATQSARMVAEQFAKDSNSRLGGIQHASQGVFQIMGRDTSTMSADWSSNQNALGSIAKKIRLVTTIDYRLK
jgi:uncharacterized protein